MKYIQLFGWGVVIYALMYLAWAGMILYGASGLGARLFQLIVLIAVSTVAGRSLRFAMWKDILPYSLIWVAEVAFLDAVYSVPFGGWQIYSDWNLWVGYALVVLIPLLAPHMHVRHHELPEIT